MKKLYSYGLDCGRMGYIESLFVADSKDVEAAIGKNVYFGEILGKHSEIYEDLDWKHLSVLSDDQEKIEWLIEVTRSEKDSYVDFETYTINGYNPLTYLEEEYDDEED